MKRKLDTLSQLYPISIGVLSFVLMLWITTLGSGVSPDSTVYLESAKNLLAGKGLFAFGEPVTHYPPLYPTLLAAIGLFEENLVQASRFLNAFIFGMSLGLVGWMIQLSTAHDFLGTFCATLVLFFSTSLIMLYSMAWSEPLFILLSLISIIFLSTYAAKPALILLVISSIFLGLAFTTRYTGIAFLPAAMIIVLMGLNDQPLGNKIRNASLLLVLACMPLGMVFIRNMMVAGSATNRSFVFHPVSISHVKGFVDTLYFLLFPIVIPDWFRAAIIGLLSTSLIAVAVILYKRRFGDVRWNLIGIVMPICCLLFAICYSLFLFFSISFFDAHTPMDARLLAPVFVLLIISVFGLAWNLSNSLKRRGIWRYLLCLATISVAFNMPRAITAAVHIQQNGQGYTSRWWRSSESMAFVKSLAQDVTIYSNGSDVIGFMSGKASTTIPEKIYANTLETNSHYDGEIETMCKDIREDKAVLVYFNAINWRWYLPTQEEIETTCRPLVLYRFVDGTVYGETHK